MKYSKLVIDIYHFGKSIIGIIVYKWVKKANMPSLYLYPGLN